MKSREKNSFWLLPARKKRKENENKGTQREKEYRQQWKGKYKAYKRGKSEFREKMTKTSKEKKKGPKKTRGCRQQSGLAARKGCLCQRRTKVTRQEELSVGSREKGEQG